MYIEQADDLKNIADKFEIEQLLTMLVIKALDSVQDQANDAINYPAVVGMSGLPTRAKMIDQAVCEIFNVWPDLIMDGEDNCEIDDPVPLRGIVKLITSAYIDINPDSIKLEYIPS